MRSWEDLKEIVSRGDLHLLQRSREAQQVYNQFMAGVRAQYASVEDFVIHKVFNYETRTNTDGKLVVVRPDPVPLQYIFRENDFPYNTAPGIEHHLLWASRGDISDTKVQEFLLSHRQGYECMTFVNPPHLQSIRGVPHAHIFSIPKSI
jgi:hypothetical protein